MDLKVAVTGHKNQVRGKSSAWFAHFNVHQLRSCDFGWISLCHQCYHCQVKSGLRFASIAYLVIGHIAFILAIYLILLEHVWVDYVLKLDPMKLTQSDIVSSL